MNRWLAGWREGRLDKALNRPSQNVWGIRPGEPGFDFAQGYIAGWFQVAGVNSIAPKRGAVA